MCNMLEHLLNQRQFTPQLTPFQRTWLPSHAALPRLSVLNITFSASSSFLPRLLAKRRCGPPPPPPPLMLASCGAGSNHSRTHTGFCGLGIHGVVMAAEGWHSAGEAAHGRVGGRPGNPSSRGPSLRAHRAWQRHPHFVAAVRLHAGKPVPAEFGEDCSTVSSGSGPKAAAVAVAASPDGRPVDLYRIGPPASACMQQAGAACGPLGPRRAAARQQQQGGQHEACLQQQ